MKIESFLVGMAIVIVVMVRSRTWKSGAKPG